MASLRLTSKISRIPLLQVSLFKSENSFHSCSLVLAKKTTTYFPSSDESDVNFINNGSEVLSITYGKLKELAGENKNKDLIQYRISADEPPKYRLVNLTELSNLLFTIKKKESQNKIYIIHDVNNPGT